jgi:type IV secretory pathway VirB6-like protein
MDFFKSRIYKFILPLLMMFIMLPLANAETAPSSAADGGDWLDQYQEWKQDQERIKKLQEMVDKRTADRVAAAKEARVASATSFEDDIKKAIGSVNKAITDFANNYREAVKPVSVSLLTYLSIISISLAGIKLALTSGSLSEPMSKMISTIFVIGLATYLISDGYETMFIDTIGGLIKHLITLTPNGTPELADMLTRFMEEQFKFIGTIMASFSELSLYDIFFKYGPSLIMLGFMFVGMLITALTAMIATLTAMVTLAIALAVGPVFIPFMVLEKTSFLFDGWVKFVINATLTKLIVAIIVGIGIASFTAIASNFVATSPDQILGSLMGTVLAAFGISGVIGVMLLSAPGLASALTSGGAINTDGFAGRMHSNAGKMARNESVSASRNIGGRISDKGVALGGKTGSAIKAIGEKLRASTSNGGLK